MLPNTFLSMFPITLQVGHDLTIQPEIFHNCSLPQVEYIFRRGMKGEKLCTKKPLKRVQSYFTEIKTEELVLWMFKLSASLFWRTFSHCGRLEQDWDAWHSSSAGDQSLSPSPWKCIWVCPNNKPQANLCLNVLEAGLRLAFYAFWLPWP